VNACISIEWRYVAEVGQYNVIQLVDLDRIHAQQVPKKATRMTHLRYDPNPQESVAILVRALCKCCRVSRRITLVGAGLVTVAVARVVVAAAAALLRRNKCGCLGDRCVIGHDRRGRFD
jgi:hypothetical protein